jgi:hypothetical protein
MMRQCNSTSRFAAELIAGPVRHGIAVAPRYALFDNDVLALTPPGAPRMPNGVETDVVLRPGEAVVVGGGALRTAAAALTAGPLWGSRPSPAIALTIHPAPRIAPERLAGWGPGLTPLGDDILVGYIAAAALAGAAVPAVDAWASRTTALSCTLLCLAAIGELPEPAHRLLEDGDPRPLLRFGATSGKGLIIGLASGSSGVAAHWDARFAVALPLPDGPRVFDVLTAQMKAAVPSDRPPAAATPPARCPSPLYF